MKRRIEGFDANLFACNRASGGQASGWQLVYLISGNLAAVYCFWVTCHLLYWLPICPIGESEHDKTKQQFESSGHC